MLPLFELRYLFTVRMLHDTTENNKLCSCSKRLFLSREQLSSGEAAGGSLVRSVRLQVSHKNLSCQASSNA